MKLSLYLDDKETERMFSYLRWVFLLVGVIVFYYPPLADRLQFTEETFPVLLAIGIVYMSGAQIALTILAPGKKYFGVLTKAGIIFDYVALIWFLVLTDGVKSPLFPISYLLIMHATIYWKTKGAILSSASMTLGYAAIYFAGAHFDFQTTFIFILNLVFIWVVGIFGSMIVIRERKHLKQKEIFHELMFVDYLTGLYNHRHFQEQLRIVSSSGQGFSLVMGDIDHFKQVNDKYGHITGDAILKKIGVIFQEIAERHNAQAFRYGGEEFAFLLPTSEEADQICFFNDIFYRLISEEFSEECKSVTMSFGMAVSDGGVLPDKLLGAADQLLYSAKAAGKDRAHFDSGFTYRFTSAKNEIAAAKL